MLFNTGFISVFAGLSIPMHLDNEADYHPRFIPQEFQAVDWLSEYKSPGFIYADVYGVFIFNKYLNLYPALEISTYSQTQKLTSEKNSYIFLRKLNQGNKLLVGFNKGLRERTKVYEDMSSIINSKNRIYENGASKIYYG